jgi:starch phosphorylase
MPGSRYSLEIQPIVPPQLERLNELSNDLLYSWDSQVRRLFQRLDTKLWEECAHNPKVFLRRVEQSKLEAAVKDTVYMQDYNHVLTAYDAYHHAQLRERRASIRPLLHPEKDLVAYFCAEFGLHESFPIYSGGLGILAGDHCKAASDLCIPFVAVGLLYRRGYFNQTIDGQGNQVSHYFETNPADLPIQPSCNSDGSEIHIQIAFPERTVHLKVWEARIGHITLYLLDSDLPNNQDSDRAITHQLYGGDRTTRIEQEIVLGIGGVRALRAVGLSPTVWHINEGHAAFQVLERCRERVSEGLAFDAALELVAGGTVFTTHTPVAAGHDIFKHELIVPYFQNYLQETGVDRSTFLKLGAFPGDKEGFNMTSLALRGSRFHNGVSQIHGGVASQMEGYIWPQIPAEENPISYVTNGVHVPTFLAREWAHLFDMQFGGGWRNELLNEDFWHAVDSIPDHSYWSVRQSLKTKLFEYTYKRACIQHDRNGCSPTQVERLTQSLATPEKDILTVGFARRFATYKRATLLFADPERLDRIVNNPERPIMFIFAGKAHPHDAPGQQFLKTIYEYSRMPQFEGKIILIENYDMALARKLVSGVDVWLNNPEYPLEASGTSGEKAGINGVLNLSVLDGWWGEGYNGENGWAITPHGPQFDAEFRDREEGNELYDLLEHQIAPLYYSRGDHGYSSEWVRKSKASMKSLMPHFSAQRMVMDYISHFYSSASQQNSQLGADDAAPARELAAWKQKVARCWSGVRMRRVDTPPTTIKADETLSIEIAVNLNGLASNDVYMECMLGKVDHSGTFICKDIYKLEVDGDNDQAEQHFRIHLNSPLAGQQTYMIRLYPYHELLARRFETGYMLWL